MQPLPGMRRYRVRVTYRDGQYPRAEILEPRPTRRSEGEPIPHTLGQDHVPCLFTPAHGDWRSTMLLGNTILPWLAEWLIFYEGWRITGTWHGNGLPATGQPKPEPTGVPA